MLNPNHLNLILRVASVFGLLGSTLSPPMKASGSSPDSPARVASATPLGRAPRHHVKALVGPTSRLKATREQDEEREPRPVAAPRERPFADPRPLRGPLGTNSGRPALARAYRPLRC